MDLAEKDSGLNPQHSRPRPLDWSTNNVIAFSDDAYTVIQHPSRNAELKAALKPNVEEISSNREATKRIARRHGRHVHLMNPDCPWAMSTLEPPHNAPVTEVQTG